MLRRIIEWSLANRFFVVLGTVAVVGGGTWAMLTTPVDAIPDLSDVQVIVETEWPGQAPQVIEDQVTYPLSTELLKVPQIRYVRGISQFGRSFVYVVFEDGVDMYWARSRVLEYLSGVGDALPEEVRPQLGPDATGVGWVMQYVLVDHSGTRDNAELRSIQDWTVRYQLTSVPGVAEVATLGGYERQYQVVLEPEQLLAHGIPISRVASALRASNLDVGGRVLELGGSEYMVRGLGYLGSVEDVRAVAVGVAPGGTPITVGDIGRVEVGPEIRRGMADLAWKDEDGDLHQGEVTGGFVVMRFGENPLEVLDRVKERIADVQASLPEGVEIVVGYDRSDLIHRAIDTLREKLIEESLIVALVAVLFLLHARSALVAIVTLPVGVLMAFLVMRVLGVNANIMSLGGIAIALGAMVDAAIVMIENMHKHMERDVHAGTSRSSWQLAADASKEVGPALFFSLLIITLSFLPIFSLGAQEGRLFTPLALTKTLAMAAAALLSITLVPVAMGAFIRGRVRPEAENLINRVAMALYRPFLDAALRHRFLTLGGALLVLAVTWLPFNRLGSEFMPPLVEGAIMDMPSVFPGIGTGQAVRMLQQRDRAMLEVPEVELVLGKAGRATTATDPAPLSMFESIAILKPEEEWRPGVDFDSLVSEMDAAVRTPGVANMWSMPIKNRLDMLATGIKTPVGIKIFGPDLATLEAIGQEIEGLLPMVPGTASVFAERAIGGRYVEVDVDRQAAARYGLTMAEVQHTVMAGRGGRERHPHHRRSGAVLGERALRPRAAERPGGHPADPRSHAHGSAGPPGPARRHPLRRRAAHDQERERAPQQHRLRGRARP